MGTAYCRFAVKGILPSEQVNMVRLFRPRQPATLSLAIALSRCPFAVASRATANRQHFDSISAGVAESDCHILDVDAGGKKEKI